MENLLEDEKIINQTEEVKDQIENEEELYDTEPEDPNRDIPKENRIMYTFMALLLVGVVVYLILNK